MSSGDTRPCFHPAADLFREIVNRLATTGADHVLMGPIVRDDADRPYFIVGTVNANDFRLDKIGAADRPLADFARAGLMVELAARRAVVIHDFDDELEMAKWAAAICPCEKTNRILTNLRAELSA